MTLVAALGAAMALVVDGACDPASSGGKPEEIVGALLPFTGSGSATGAALERAILMAAETINTHGGMAGRYLRVVTRDTHSDLGRGLSSADELLALGPLAIIGPPEDELSRAVALRAIDAGVTFLSPSSALTPAGQDEVATFWLRTATSTLILAQGLAKRMIADGVRTVSIVGSDDPYGRSFAEAATQRFQELGGQVAQTSYRSSSGLDLGISELADGAARSDALLLVAQPGLATAVVNHLTIRSGHLRWYLSPSLETDVFLRGVIPHSLDGGVGVAAAVDAQPAQEFSEIFANRWNGARPPTDAYYYYDTMALLGLSLATVATEDGDGLRDGNRIRDSILSTASQYGAADTSAVLAYWNGLPRAMATISQGLPVRYFGVTGVMKFSRNGEREVGASQAWYVDDAEPMASMP